MSATYSPCLAGIFALLLPIQTLSFETPSTLKPISFLGRCAEALWLTPLERALRDYEALESAFDLNVWHDEQTRKNHNRKLLSLAQQVFAKAGIDVVEDHHNGDPVLSIVGSLANRPGRLVIAMNQASLRADLTPFESKIFFHPSLAFRQGADGLFQTYRARPEAVYILSGASLRSFLTKSWDEITAHEVGVHFNTTLAMANGRLKPYLGRIMIETKDKLESLHLDEITAYQHTIPERLKENRLQAALSNLRTVKYIIDTYEDFLKLLEKKPIGPEFFKLSIDLGKSGVIFHARVVNPGIHFYLQIPLLKSRGVDDPRNIDHLREQLQIDLKELKKDKAVYDDLEKQLAVQGYRL